MPTLQLCISKGFERECNDKCHQFGSFALIATTIPYATENRLNVGWFEPCGPRKGSTSPSLAYFSDWRIVHDWQITDYENHITNTPEFRKTFARPCVVAVIIDRLNNDDKRKFPELDYGKAPKNSINNIFYFTSNSQAILKNADCTDSEDYEKLVLQSIIAQVQSVINILGVEIVEKDEIDDKEDHDVKD